jgi:hypothetical protein
LTGDATARPKILKLRLDKNKRKMENSYLDQYPWEDPSMNWQYQASENTRESKIKET